MKIFITSVLHYDQFSSSSHILPSVSCSPLLSSYLLCFLHSRSPLSVLSPLLCSRGLYFTVPWVLLSDSTADPEAARKSYSALYQRLCCLAVAIRRVLTPSSLHDHHQSCQTQSCTTDCTPHTQPACGEILCALYICAHVYRYLRVYCTNFTRKCIFKDICVIQVS